MTTAAAAVQKRSRRLPTLQFAKRARFGGCRERHCRGALSCHVCEPRYGPLGIALLEAQRPFGNAVARVDAARRTFGAVLPLADGRLVLRPRRAARPHGLRAHATCGARGARRQTRRRPRDVAEPSPPRLAAGGPRRAPERAAACGIALHERVSAARPREGRAQTQ